MRTDAVRTDAVRADPAGESTVCFYSQSISPIPFFPFSAFHFYSPFTLHLSPFTCIQSGKSVSSVLSVCYSSTSSPFSLFLRSIIKSCKFCHRVIRVLSLEIKSVKISLICVIRVLSILFPFTIHFSLVSSHFHPSIPSPSNKERNFH